MAIKELTKITLGKSKSGWRWDRKREIWITWQVDTIFLGKRHIRRGLRSEADAKEYLRQLDEQERLKNLGIIQIIKFPQAAELFEKYAASLSKKEAVRARRVFKAFLKLLPQGITVNEIKRAHTKKYIENRTQSIKDTSANREVNCISAALNSAGDFYPELEGWTASKVFRAETDDDSRQRVISKPEREKLLNYFFRPKDAGELPRQYFARRRAGLTFHFALLTGLRHGEITALEKINFDESSRRLRAERFKTRRSGVRWTTFEPLTPTQMQILKEAAELYPDSKYFFSEHGKVHNKTYEVFDKACKKLEIPYGRYTPNGLIFHDTRHTFITILEQGAIDSSTTRSFSGHSKDSMLKRYAHATADSRARAMQVIEKEIGGESKDFSDELKKIYEAAVGGKLEFPEFRKSLEDLFAVF